MHLRNSLNFAFEGKDIFRNEVCDGELKDELNLSYVKRNG